MGPQRVLLLVDCVSTKDLMPIPVHVNRDTAEMATTALVPDLFLFSLFLSRIFSSSWGFILFFLPFKNQHVSVTVTQRCAIHTPKPVEPVLEIPRGHIAKAAWPVTTELRQTSLMIASFLRHPHPLWPRHRLTLPFQEWSSGSLLSFTVWLVRSALCSTSFPGVSVRKRRATSSSPSESRSLS